MCIRDRLKAFGRQVENGTLDEAPAARMKQLVKKLEQETARSKEAGLLGRRDERVRRSAAAYLEDTGREMELAGLDEPISAWEWLRGRFGARSDSYEEGQAEAGAMLEHAFDFMEAAFGDSQEMVAFVTELNTNYYSIQFLKENDCDKYYRYNKRLLFDEQQQEILKELDEVEQDLNTALK